MFQSDYVETIRYILKGRNEFFGSKAMVSTFEGAEYVNDESVSICFTGYKEPFANGVWQHFTTPFEEENIEAILDSLAIKKLPFFWWESPIPYGKDLPLNGKEKTSNTGEILIRRGLECGGVLTGVHVDLNSLTPSDKKSSKISIRQVHTIAELEQFCSIICSTFEMSPENAKHFIDLCLIPFENGSERHYLAYVDECPIAGVTFSTGKCAAGVWNFATQSEYRCQGIGSALVQAALNDAKKMGYQNVMAILLSDGMSELWRKLNFQEICKFPYYISTSSM